MATTVQVPELAPKKLPTQARSRLTFEAIVEAATGLLPERGYGGTTTNHVAERAGVNIASLYEYFPGKDAIVAQVAERLVERVLARLAEDAARVAEAPDELAMRRWLELIHATVARERELVAVFLYQVPFTNQLPPIRELSDRLLAFSQELQQRAGGFVQPGFSDATLHLVINLVSSTILQLVLDPPKSVSPEALFDELVARVEAWIRGPDAVGPRA